MNRRITMKKLFSVKLTVKNMAYMALLLAMQVVLTYVDNVIPEMPQGGSWISFAIIPIFLTSYLMGVGYGVIVGCLGAIMQFILGLAKYFGPWSVLLDYLLPLAVCGLAALLPNIKLKKREICIGVVLSMVLKFLSHYLSGALLFASSAPEGQNPFWYSFYYNLPYNAITLVSSIIIVSLIYPPLKKAIKL